MGFACGRAAALLCLTLACAAPAAAELVLDIRGGKVSIVARDVPLRQILSEWERVGGTDMVNAEQVGGAPVTIELHGVTEQQALEVLLRPVAGYMASTQPTGVATRSSYTRVIILARSTPPRAATAPAAARLVPRAPAPEPDLAPDAEDEVLVEPPPDAQPDRADDRDALPPVPLRRAPVPAATAPTTRTPPAPPPPMRPAAGTPFGANAGAATPGVIAPVAPPGYPAQVPVSEP